jgi:hypothetical protein
MTEAAAEAMRVQTPAPGKVLEALVKGEYANPVMLDCLAQMVQRKMRRELMTGFDNARLDQRSTMEVDVLPRTAAGKGRSGFVQ